MLGFNGGTIGIANTVFTGTKSGDPNYSNVSLLLNGNGTNGSTTFTDSSSYGHTVTPVSNAQISTAQSKFGGASMYFDAGSGDYLTVPSGTTFQFGVGDFTIEAWVYITSLAFYLPILEGRAIDNYSNYVFGIYNVSGTLRLDFVNVGGGTGRTATSTSVPLNTWTHVAWVRSNGTTSYYVNGTKDATTNGYTGSLDPASTSSLRIGSIVNPHYFNGYIDDLRITKGVARYTSNFTPPTAQLPGGETGTFASGLWTSSDHIKQIRNELWPGFVPSIVTDGLVLHLDAGDSASYPGSGTTWTDLSGNGNNGTINGATYDSANGGSLSFDGVNDYISTPVAGTFSQITFEFMGFFDDPTLNTLSREESAFGDWTNSRVHFGTRWTGSNAGMHFNVNNVWNTTPATNLRYGWNHYLLVYDTVNDLKRVYLNNILSSSVGTNGNMTIGDFRIGVATNLNRYYRGNIANFKIYNRALTQSEITQNYNALKGRYGL